MAASIATLDYADLIGKRFEYGGRGPDCYDCYGLVKELLNRLGQDVPDYKSPTEAAKIIALMLSSRAQWKETTKKPGAVALIKVMGNLHVGFVLPYNRFIHTWEKSGGVVVEHFYDWEKRVMAYYEYESTSGNSEDT